MHRRFLMVVLGVVALEIGSGAAVMLHAQGQPPKPTKKDSIPKEYRPPAGMCRIWIENVRPAQQPAPTDCATAVRNRPSNGRVIYGEDKDKAKKALPGQLPIKSFKPVERKKPPLALSEWDDKKITDEQLFGDRPAGIPPALSSQGVTVGAGGVMGSYEGYVPTGGVVVGTGPINDPRYFAQGRGVTPPGYGSRACLDRDADGWCDDARFGPPACLDRDRDGRCDDLPGFASQAYPQTLPPMRAALDVLSGRGSVEVMQWLGTNEFTVRVPDQGRGGLPWRAIFLDQNNGLLQVWTDRDRDGRADRVEVFRNGQRVKLFQR